MVKTLKPQRVALLFPHDGSAAVWTDVHQGVNHALTVAIEDHLATGNAARDEIAGIGDFGFMAEVDPAPIEQRPALGLQHVRVSKGLASHFEPSALPVLSDKIGVGMRNV